MDHYRTRFLESLDTVRDAPDTGDLRQRRRQAKAEILLSLLFGEPVAIPEPVSFDSRFFLQQFDEILAARAKLSPEEKMNGTSSPVWKPFRLALFNRLEGVSTGQAYLSMVSRRLKNPGFILSSHPDWERDTGLRTYLAGAITADKFLNSKWVPRSVDNSFEGYVASLKAAATHFNELRNHEVLAAKPVTGPMTLANRVARLLDNYQIDSRQAPAIRELHKLGTHFDNRTEVRLNGRTLGIDPNVLAGILEGIDDSYNRVVAASIGSQTSMFSLLGNSENDQVIESDAFSRSIDANADDDSGTYVQFSLADDLNGLDQLKWEDVWPLLVSAEFVRSVTKLHDGLREKSPFHPDGLNAGTYDQALDDLRYHHVKLVGEYLQKLKFEIEWNQAGYLRLQVRRALVKLPGRIIKGGMPAILTYIITGNPATAIGAGALGTLAGDVITDAGEDTAKSVWKNSGSMTRFLWRNTRITTNKEATR